MEKVPMGPPPSRSPKYSAPSNSDLEPNSETIPIAAEDSAPSTAPQVEVCQADAIGTDNGDVSQQTAPPEVSPEAKEENGCPLASEVSSGSAVPYSIPPWSDPPGQPFNFEVLKEGTIVEKFDVSAKGAYMFGRVDLCDFVLEHPTISRFHAVLQFNKNGEAFLYDVGSTHGTFINKNMLKKKVYTEVHVGDVIRFGRSSRLYIFQGPAELMPPEGDLDKLRRGKMQQELQDREDSLVRAKVQASLADGISWGMAEDAIEESNQNDEEEVTWQSFKGQLTERQEKTRSKIIKRMEKVANMKKEIDSIRVKDISQGGLTQGQQTQIARNEQRISQIMEELDSLEETLNESIQESIGAKNKNFPSIGKKNQEEDEYISDDDEFYDRTKKSDFKKTNDKQSVETADSLLDKKDSITKEMEEKRSLLQQQTVKSDTYEGKASGEEDVLDAYMAGLSSNLARDKATKIQDEIRCLQSELDRIVYLLQIADPSGEAAKKRTEKSSTPVHPSLHAAIPNVREHVPIEKRKASTTHKLASDLDSADSASTSQSPVEKNDDQEKRRKTTYSVVKPQWLGAKQDALHEEKNVEFAQDSHDTEGFINYKDRKKALANGSNKSCIEEACSGLIIRKEKHIQTSTLTGCISDTEMISSLSEVEKTTTDAMALLLKHKRGYVAEDDDMDAENKHNQEGGVQQTSKPKRVLGPEKPAFLDDRQDFQSWVPPEGQVGDGRTALNEKFGY